MVPAEEMSNQAAESQAIYTPGEAARLLSVTTQSLRRYADDYAEVFEPVQTHAKQRVFNDQVVERLRVAQALQQQGTVPSIKAGLERVRDGDAIPSDLATPPANTPFEKAVLERLAVQDEMLRQLHEENRVLHDHLGELRQLPGSDEGGREAELARMNRYLLAELERRRLEAEAREKPRQWWRLWGKP